MKKAILATVVATCITMGGLSTVAFADTTAGTAPTSTSTTTNATTTATSPFDTKYQANLSTETQLLQQAQSANSTDSNVTALLTAVQTITQQVSTLYGVEQALYAAKSSIPTANPQEEQRRDELTKLGKQRQGLLSQSNNEWKLVNQYSKQHKKSLLNAAVKAHNETEKKLVAVDNEMKGLEQKVDNGDWKNHPYDGGLTELQDSILRLQASAIHYTKEAIALEGSTGTGTATNTDGSTNTSGSGAASTNGSSSGSTTTGTGTSTSTSTPGGGSN